MSATLNFCAGALMIAVFRRIDFFGYQWEPGGVRGIKNVVVVGVSGVVKKWNNGLREDSDPLTFTRSSLILSRCR